MNQEATQHIENDDRPEIADMRIVIDGRAAAINGHFARDLRDKDLFFGT
jgi:hypothetical protein